MKTEIIPESLSQSPWLEGVLSSNELTENVILPAKGEGGDKEIKE
jgi:hypothetical protein